MDVYDITIVGAGPAGMFAAFYAGMRNAKTKIIDTLPKLGGQLTTLYPEKYIYDIPGFPKIKADELAQNLEKQLTMFNHRYCLEEEVVKLNYQDDLIEIVTNQRTHYSKAVILALGNGSFQPRRLRVEQAEKFENNGIDYFISDLMKYAGKKVVIAGGGDSAVDWALMLEPIAKEVSIVHRRDKFRAHEHSIQQLKNSSVQILTPYIIRGVKGEQSLDTLHLQVAKSDETADLAVDYLIVNYGFSTNLDLKEWQINSSRQGIPVNSDMKSSRDGVYCCGDITLYDGKVDLIATGFGEAPTAVNNALHYIDPKNRTQPMHSSSLFQ
ncbi:NAD(P)/FAD-dependent oxidoreductase [Tetragenococcus koreensis]|uniref:NAD(P)/FAD-dependent oxidoreductase n=1 Tax=Tetragenococcus koreensis TaxID=290335 RepID=UPI001F415546|nr:NAD(P)/FAD-dependent oxidoreductase [Tetragenococcus koreensis]MCF1585854.1 NAD(P)/FAD-dependent oxidoreductase [Tetragenococcus koreensis]MCF1615424.1 NAD(P)/FAD-dependent oxidoreductase [Tetragenococcus koreensis]MCF1619185.1 NAD(P)/FAD-dependent oxidoreductase [Tetragenococcus koreensis]MCF1625221.1 NAD(P)/FAD-dependent oxidoreductase [Tetragenococcus koreensis]MCF1630118.1 NAD(P)/FAD-dependent oxidoreductase [Tetragenococcus koreensis]